MEIVISKKQDGKTVGQILRNDLAFSSNIITFLKKKPNGIMLGGVHATVRNKVVYGDVLRIDYSDDTEPFDSDHIVPTDLPFDIVYRDDDIIVVNKPCGMPTHPSHSHQTDTLANGLAHMCRVVGSPFVFRPVNRLDMDTSGLVLIAQNKLAAYRLSEAMKKGEIHKSYFSVVCGKIDTEKHEIMSYVKRAEDSKMLRCVCDKDDEGAMLALTRYKTLIASDMFSAVIAAPITGRTHQLRLHFASEGHPICGDTLYGYPYEYIGRQALHACRLSFSHPRTGERLHITAPLPHDISYLCRQVFGTDQFSYFR